MGFSGQCTTPCTSTMDSLVICVAYLTMPLDTVVSSANSTAWGGVRREGRGLGAVMQPKERSHSLCSRALGGHWAEALAAWLRGHVDPCWCQ